MASVLIHVVNLVVPWDSVLLEDRSGLFALELGNFDAAQPLLLLHLRVKVLLAEVNEINRVDLFVLELAQNGMLTFDVVLHLLALGGGLLDVHFHFDLRLLGELQLLLGRGGLLLSFSQLILELLQGGDSVGRGSLQEKKLVVAVVNVLNVFLVLNLQLMEVNELELLTHLALVLDLLLLLHNSSLQTHILGLKFVDKLFFLLQFVIHVLRELFCIVLADATVFGGGKETAEIERFLTDFSNREISALQNGLETLEQGLRLLTALLNV